jgi:D-3-phosphoglycerate dehydrogenase
MLRAMDRYRGAFESQGVEVHCPDVVQVLPESTLRDLLPAFDGWIAGDDPASRPVLTAGRAGKLRAVVRWGIGIDNVDLAAIDDLGLLFCNTPGQFGNEVADVALGYLIGLARMTFQIDRQVRRGEWPKPAGTSLSGKTVALVGFGDVGRCIARRLLVLGTRVIAYDPAYQPAAGLESVEVAVWPSRVEEAHFLVLACALTEANHHLVDGAVLQSVRPGLHVVNVARGPLIDESALVMALEHGRVGGAALDVFESEPLSPSSRLRDFEQCVFGSHNASNTEEAVDRASLEATARVLEFLS